MKAYLVMGMISLINFISKLLLSLLGRDILKPGRRYAFTILLAFRGKVSSKDLVLFTALFQPLKGSENIFMVP